MRLVEVDKLPGKAFYKPTKVYKLLCEFRDSSMDCAKIEDYDYKNATSAQASIRNSIKHFKFLNIVCTAREGNVYLLKTNKE